MSNQNSIGFSINIFVVDGSLDGLKKIDKPGWDGMAVICPHMNFSETKKRCVEFSSGGVYLFVGNDNDSDENVIYIGIADDFSARLGQHHDVFKKDFWQQVIIFTKKDRPLDKTENSYLEHRLVKLAKDTKRYRIENRQVPQEPNMTEAGKVSANAFFHSMLQIISVMGVSAFKEAPIKSVIVSNNENSENVENDSGKFTLTRNGCEATGYPTDGGFVVQEGSTANKKNSKTLSLSREEQRKHFHDKGLFVEDGDFYRFAKDYEFSSPSLAASIVAGMNENGLTMWRNNEGTLKEYLDSATQES